MGEAKIWISMKIICEYWNSLADYMYIPFIFFVTLFIMLQIVLFFTVSKKYYIMYSFEMGSHFDLVVVIDNWFASLASSLIQDHANCKFSLALVSTITIIFVTLSFE